MRVSGGAIAREAAIVIGGAVLAALIIGQVPALRIWIASQWAAGGCSCGGNKPGQ